MKSLLFLAIALNTLCKAFAQTPCSEKNIHGTWKECGEIRSPTYNHPPANINTDSLKQAFHRYNDSAGKTWYFMPDGSYRYNMMSMDVNGKGRFWVKEEGCALKLSSRKRNPIRIVYLDDSCLMLWHNNPKTAYITVYRR
jgi:hypothetical protein